MSSRALETPSPPPDRQFSGEGKTVPSPPESPPENDVSPENQPASLRNPGFPNREDCWSEDATRTLIDAWGSHYLQLNRGNLRQKHWEAVSEAVNARHAVTAKLKRTDVQCKNRIDTIKKKYKIEKSKVAQSNGRYVSTWPHFQSLDSFIGHSFSKANGKNADANGHSGKRRRRDSSSSEKSSSPSTGAPHYPKSPISNHRGRDPVATHLPNWSVPVGPRSKRAGPGIVTERNFSVMAAAAAAMEAEEEDEYYDDGEENEEEEHNSSSWRRPPTLPPATSSGMKRSRPSHEEGSSVGEGYAKLAESISKLAQIYEKVEEAKQRQMVEMEKQRIQFTKDLELQRMQMFVECQVRLEKLKRAKPSS